MELDEHNQNIVTKMHCYFEPWKTMNEVQAFLADLHRGARESHVETVIEEMRRDAARQLYIRIGFRACDGDGSTMGQ